MAESAGINVVRTPLLLLTALLAFASDQRRARVFDRAGRIGN